MNRDRNCLVTVVTPSFIVGAMTMLHSFKEHNSWFNGEIVVIHSGLDEKVRQDFDICFGQIQWMPVSLQLVNALTKLTRVYPNHVAERFYSLEIFRIVGYRKVLFCDGDLLFLDSIKNLFDRSEALLCCGDIFHYQKGSNSSQHINTFNAGMLLFDNSLLGYKVYNELLAWLEPSKWKEFEPTVYNDQKVLNHYFSGHQVLVGCEYNYLLAFRKELQKKTEISLKNAKVLHFNGPLKPWNLTQILGAAKCDPGIVKAFELWSASYAGMLAKTALRQKLKIIQEVL